MSKGITAMQGFFFSAHIPPEQGIEHFWFTIDENDGTGPKVLKDTNGSPFAIEQDDVVHDPNRSFFYSVTSVPADLSLRLVFAVGILPCFFVVIFYNFFWLFRSGLRSQIPPAYLLHWMPTTILCSPPRTPPSHSSPPSLSHRTTRSTLLSMGTLSSEETSSKTSIRVSRLLLSRLIFRRLGRNMRCL
jgi:hypothetical protein